MEVFFMEKTKVITKLDFRTLKYCNLFLMKYQRRTVIWLIAVTVLALGIGAYGYFGYSEPQYIFIAFGGVFALYSVYQMFTLEKKLDTTLANFFRNRRVTTQTVEVDSEKVTVVRSVDPENPQEYDWAVINQIFEMPQYYMLMAGKNIPLILDRSEEALIEGTKENLDAIIHEKAQAKPYKSTDEDIVKIPITYVHPVFSEEPKTEETVSENKDLPVPEENGKQEDQDKKE